MYYDAQAQGTKFKKKEPHVNSTSNTFQTKSTHFDSNFNCVDLP